MQISQESTCIGVFFNIVAGPQNRNFVKKRLHHRFFLKHFLNYLRASILYRIDERLVLKHQYSFIRTSYFKEHLQWLLLTVSGSSLQLYCLKETLAKFISEFCKIFKNIFRQNISGWLHLWILGGFPDHFFYRAPLGNCLFFHARVAGFQPQDTIRSISQVLLFRLLAI